MEPAELVRTMNGVASILRGASDLDGTLSAIVEAAHEVAGVEQIALSWANKDTGRSAARLSDACLGALETIQDEVGEGPALDALSTEAMGYASAVCLPLMGDQAAVATLSLYAHGPGRFDEEARQVAQLLASRTEAALAFATTVENLHDAPDSRTSIGAAVGIVMERFSLDKDGAFRFRVRLSQNGNVTLRTVAEKLIESQASD